MNRPKSAGDAQVLTLAREDMHVPPEPASSPTKGILMTPGASAAKKKNVTFGEHVLDNEEKRPMKSGLHDDCPGKYPSPFNGAPGEADKVEDVGEKGRGRSKLTEALEQARDENTKRKAKTERRGKHVRDEEEENVPAGFEDPKSESGKYWKHEYDIYRNNTQREVRKLITKQKAAKSFAKEKDEQCTELADQLRQERKKVESLEAKTSELERQMKELQDKLREGREAEMNYLDEIAGLKRQIGRRDYARPGSQVGMVDVPSLQRTQSGPQAGREPVQREKDSAQEPERGPIERRESEQWVSKRPGQPEKDLVQRPSEITQLLESKQPTSDDPVQASKDPVQRPSGPVQRASELGKPSGGSNNTSKSEAQTLKARPPRSKPDMFQVKDSNDIWAQALGSSSPIATRSTERPPISPSGGRTVTSGTDATPLKTLSINTQQSPRADAERASKPLFERKDSKTSPQPQHQRETSPLISPSLPKPSPETQSPAKSTELKTFAQRKQQLESKPVAEDISFSLSMPVAASSPFEPDAKASSLRTTPLAAPSGLRPAPAPALESAPKTAMPSNSNAKENVSPTPKARAPRPAELSVKHSSAIWSSTNSSQVNAAAPQAARPRNASVLGKDGKEVGMDRLEAARARIAARGRVVS